MKSGGYNGEWKTSYCRVEDIIMGNGGHYRGEWRTS